MATRGAPRSSTPRPPTSPKRTSIPNDEVVVTLTANGYIKRIATGAYRAQRRGGKGSRGMTTHEDDAVAHLLCTHAHDSLLFFTDRGRVFQLKAYGLPDVGRAAKGDHLRNLIGIDQQETVTALVCGAQVCRA